MDHLALRIATGVAALLILVPLPTKIRVGNLALLTMIGNGFLIDFIHSINAAVWVDHAHDVAPIWCDISGSISFSGWRIWNFDHHSYSYQPLVLLPSISVGFYTLHLQTSRVALISGTERLR